jgi:hypothetical protein
VANRLPGDAGLDDVKSELDMVRDLIKEKKELAGLTRITVYGNGSTALPDKDNVGKSALDTEEDRIERHIAKMGADTPAVGQNAGSLEQAGPRFRGRILLGQLPCRLLLSHL